jgi:hypothetical protein
MKHVNRARVDVHVPGPTALSLSGGPGNERIQTGLSVRGHLGPARRQVPPLTRPAPAAHHRSRGESEVGRPLAATGAFACPTEKGRTAGKGPLSPTRWRPAMSREPNHSAIVRHHPAVRSLPRCSGTLAQHRLQRGALPQDFVLPAGPFSCLRTRARARSHPCSASPYRSGPREIARTEGATLVEDSLEGVVPARTYDGLHPNEQGQAILAERLVPVPREGEGPGARAGLRDGGRR